MCIGYSIAQAQGSSLRSEVPARHSQLALFLRATCVTTPGKQLINKAAHTFYRRAHSHTTHTCSACGVTQPVKAFHRTKGTRVHHSKASTYAHREACHELMTATAKSQLMCIMRSPSISLLYRYSCIVRSSSCSPLYRYSAAARTAMHMRD